MRFPQALEICLRKVRPEPGRFYGPADDLPLGSGLILKDCPLALTHPSEMRFQTALGLALVLTHECDADTRNDRYFNDHVLVCPIIPLDDFCAAYEDHLGPRSWAVFLDNLAAGHVFRAMYLPPPNKPLFTEELESGGIIYLNTISSCRVSWLENLDKHAICSLSEPAHWALDFKIRNHFLREKPTRLRLGQST